MIVFVAPRNVPVKCMAVVGNLDASSGLPQSREIHGLSVEGVSAWLCLWTSSFLSRQWLWGMECGGGLGGWDRDVHLS